METIGRETSDNQISGYNRESIKYKRKKTCVFLTRLDWFDIVKIA